MDNVTKYQGNELKYIEQVLGGDAWSSLYGNFNQRLEKKTCELIGSDYGVSFNSGTSTLHAALEALGIGAGDFVATPALTVIMDTTCILHANAIPLYIDVDPATFNMDTEDLEKKVKQYNPKAIIVVSLYGMPCDMDRIMETSRKYNIPVIEDNAQSFLSKYDGRYLGTIGHLSSFSFENTKHISCGEGGMILTDDKELAQACRKIGGHGFKNLQADEGRVRLRDDDFRNPDYKRHDYLGWNYRLSEFNAAIALAQMERANELISMRIDSAKLFLDVMKDCDFLVPQKESEKCVSTYYTLGVFYNEEKAGVSWKYFQDAFVKNGGDAFYGCWSVPYLEPFMQDSTLADRNPDVYHGFYWEQGLCPIAEFIQPHIMQFKTNYRDSHLMEHKAEALAKTIKHVRGN